jgi:hypothetical protein
LLPRSFVPAFPHDHTEPREERWLQTSEGSQPYLNLTFWGSFATQAGLPGTCDGRIGSDATLALPSHKGSFAPIGPGTVPVETVKVIRPKYVSGLSRTTFYSAARGAQASKKGLPFLPFGSFEKAFFFLFAEKAGTYVTTTTRSRNNEAADEL